MKQISCGITTVPLPVFCRSALVVFLLLFAWQPPLQAQQPTGRISGTITDQFSGMPLAGCNVFVRELRSGTVSDSLGNFELTVPLGPHRLICSFVGYESFELPVNLIPAAARAKVFVRLVPSILQGNAVEVSELQSGPLQIMAEADIRRMPSLYADPLRSLKVLPGVSSNNELSSAYNVRGGNYDENLIYLNGFEIYRPFLLRSGVEENQSLINPDLVHNLRFYSGGFPAEFGDKLSSALEVNYAQGRDAVNRWTLRADLLALGLATRGSKGRLRWAGGVRYANPGLFVNRLQTSGSYRPFFADAQVLLEWNGKRDDVQLFLLQAQNRFDLTPDTWTGNFKFNLLDVRAIEINYDGSNAYTFTSALAGLNWNHRLTETRNLRVSLAGYDTREKEQTDLVGNIYYLPDASEPGSGREYLKSRLEQVDNRLHLQTLEAKVLLEQHFAQHRLLVGFSNRLIGMDNRQDERFQESGGESTQEEPLRIRVNQNETLNYLSVFAQHGWQHRDNLQLVSGLRVFHYGLTGETRISPRVSLSWIFAGNQSLRLSSGIYEQPPLFYELQGLEPARFQGFHSQQSIHTSLNYEKKLSSTLAFNSDIYYKKLNRLIPYYIDELKLVYQPEERTSGYTYGMDLSLKGEVVEGLNSWLSYSYLKSRARLAGNGNYRRRILDQTHSARIFLQDRVPQFPDFQVHLRLLFGSGYLYHPRVVSEQNGQEILVPDLKRLERFQHFARADLGMSLRLNFPGGHHAVLSGEVLNVFNHINVAGYSWFQVFPGEPLRIPRVYTRRFFNLGAEVHL